MLEWRTSEIARLLQQIEELERDLAAESTLLLNAKDYLNKVRTNVPDDLGYAIDEVHDLEGAYILTKGSAEVARSQFEASETDLTRRNLENADETFLWIMELYELAKSRLSELLADRARELDSALTTYNSRAKDVNDLASQRDLAVAQHNAIVNMRDCPVTLRPGDAEEFTNDLINSVTSSTVLEEPKTFVFEQDPLPFGIEEQVASYASGAESTTTVPATPTSSVVDESEVPTSTVESSGDSASSPENPETSDAGSDTSGPPTETTAASSTSLVSTTTITEVQESFVPLPSPEPLVVPEYGPIPDERILDSARAFLSTPTAVTTTRPAAPATTSTDVELMRQILSVLASLPDNEIPESSAELPVIAYVRQRENNGATGTGGGDVAVVGSGFLPQSQVVVADRRGTVRASSLSSDAGQVNLTVEIPSTGDRSLVVLAGKDAEGVRRAIPVIVTNLPASSDESTLTAGAGEDMSSTTTTAEDDAVEGVDSTRDEPPPQGDEPAVLWWFALLVTVLLVGLWARNRRRQLEADHDEGQSP